MKKAILSVMFLLIVSISYAGEKPWYERLDDWFFTKTWLGRNAQQYECQKNNYFLQQVYPGRKYSCYHPIWHGPKG